MALEGAKPVRVTVWDDTAKTWIKWDGSLTLGAADIQIGAVEIKNATDDTRATVGSSGLHVDVRAIIPGTGATNLGKAINDPVGATDTGVLVLAKHSADPVHLVTAHKDYDSLHLSELGALRTKPETEIHFDDLDATTGWAAFDGDTTNLAVTSKHMTGTKALTFDKANTGADNTLAGIEKTITAIDLGDVSLHDVIQMGFYLPSLTGVSYIFCRVGTDSSNYNEWRILGTELIAATFEIGISAVGDVNYAGVTGNGWDPSAITYIAVGVAFDAETNTLAGMVFDQLAFFTNSHSSALLGLEVSTSITSPNITIKKWGAKSVTNAATLADNTSSPTAPMVGAAGMWYDGSNWDMARGDATNGLLVNLGSNNDVTVSGVATSANQLADGHAVTIDNTSSNEVFVRGSQSAGSPVDGEVVTIQGIASMTALSVTESSPISGFATSANQLADGHNVTVDNATGGPVFTQHNITGIVDGVKTVSTAGTDEALASTTACKKVVVQAQTDNTGLIAVGATGVDATEATGTGIILYSGDTITVQITDLADVFIDSSVSGEGVRFTYFT